MAWRSRTLGSSDTDHGITESPTRGPMMALSPRQSLAGAPGPAGIRLGPAPAALAGQRTWMAPPPPPPVGPVWWSRRAAGPGEPDYRDLSRQVCTSGPRVGCLRAGPAN